MTQDKVNNSTIFIYLIHNSIIFEEDNTSDMILGDAPAFVRMPLICLVFSIQVMLISFLSTISLIANISTSNRFLRFILKYAQHRIDFGCQRMQ